MQNIYATCVSINHKGVLIIGPSGAGKSDLALRLIGQVGAELVSDDRTILTVKDKEIYATSPENIKGLLEIRGIGITQQTYVEEEKIKLIVELVDDYAKIERLPQKEYEELENIKVRKIKIYPFEGSSVYKIKVACDEKE